MTVCGGWDEGRWGHLSTATAMRARTSNVIGGLGWRLPWFLFPICAADLPAGNARPRERRDGSTTQPRFPLSGQSELAFAKLGYDLLCTQTGKKRKGNHL